MRSRLPFNLSATAAAGRLFGAAAAEGDALLTLTGDDAFFAAGSAVFDVELDPPLLEEQLYAAESAAPPPPRAAVHSFEARFAWRVAPRADRACADCEAGAAAARLRGDGLSFSFGDIPLGLVSERGAGACPTPTPGLAPRPRPHPRP